MHRGIVRGVLDNHVHVRKFYGTYKKLSFAGSVCHLFLIYECEIKVSKFTRYTRFCLQINLKAIKKEVCLRNPRALL